MDAQLSKVLLIEDSPAAAELVRSLLTDIRDKPFTLECADRLSTGLERLAAGGVDVVLLDLWLPESEGLDTLLRVRQQAPSLPVVVLTGLNDETLAVKAVQAGAEDYLIKGQVDSHSLGRSLRYAIERTRRRQAEECLRVTAEEFHAARNRFEEQIRRRNRELLETTALLNSILEGSTEYSIIATDLQGTILTWNEGARRTYGYTPEEVVGKQNVRILHAPEDVAAGKVQAPRKTALRTGKVEGVFQCVRQDGRRFLASTVVTLRQSAEGEPVGFVRISRDITEQQRLEEQLRRTNEELAEQNRRVRETDRLKSEFLAGMSHELRTPLNGILGFAELMHDGKVGPVSAEHKEYLGDILTSARYLLRLINDVLDLAKVESGKVELRPEPIDLARLVGEIRDILRTLAAKKRIKVETDIDPGPGEVVVDPARLKQVLYNYLSNALKFTPEEGRVMLRARPEGADAFRLEVEDTGIGIRPEDMGRLWVEFQRLHPRPGGQFPGTGLGLALTKRIVEAQGGQVGVRSTPGQGSVFFALLPRVARGTSAVAPSPPRQPRAGTPTVLVIEDTAEERAWLTEALTRAGYAVRTAATGAEAVAECRQRAFDAITLDLLLPDMSSREVLEAIRAKGLNQTVPVIVLTVVAERGAVAGFNIHDFFAKPVQAQELLASLTRAGVKARES